MEAVAGQARAHEAGGDEAGRPEQEAADNVGRVSTPSQTRLAAIMTAGVRTKPTAAPRFQARARRSNRTSRTAARPNRIAAKRLWPLGKL